jgi:hypothetical protein
MDMSIGVDMSYKACGGSFVSGGDGPSLRACLNVEIHFHAER